MLIANATGCSSIWGGTAMCNPYTTTPTGQGPAWANSLFEDNAEYGFGMLKANAVRRNQLVETVSAALGDTHVPMSPALRSELQAWIANRDNGKKATASLAALAKMLEPVRGEHPLLDEMYRHRDMFPKISQV
jgi:pyruvate-ferredoxin/flavodoxin oxidoreductase